MLDFFSLQGTSYRQEYRKCNNANCKCHRPDHDGHGPYWYARSWTGSRQYIGKQLPPHITATREAHNSRHQEMSDLRTRLAAELHAVDALIATMYLSDDDKATLTDLGYADCLVPRCRDGMPDPTR